MENLIDMDDKLAMAIGRATSKWAHAETHLGNVFATLSGIDAAMAITVFRFFKSVDTQRQALLRVAALSTTCNDEDYATLNAILVDYEKLADRRNEIEHHPFGWMPGHQQIYQMQKETTSKVGEDPYSRVLIDSAEVEALTAEITAVVERIAYFSVHLMRQRLPNSWLDSLADGGGARGEPEKLEGIVSSRRNSRYVTASTTRWVKVKAFIETEYEILGVQRDPGKPTMALMGEPGSREYVGGASVTFGRPKAEAFKAFVEANLGVAPLGFGQKPSGTVQWLQPGAVGTVRHLRGADKLRHARLMDFR